MDLVFGIPAHPLIVHAAVVLVPLAAFGVIVLSLVQRWRSKYSGLVALLAAVAAGVMPLASESGEALARRVEFTDATTKHLELGETGTAAGIAVLVAALAIWWLQRNRGTKLTRGIVGKLVPVLAIALALGATAQIVRIGHSGAESVWSKAADITDYSDSAESE